MIETHLGEELEHCQATLIEKDDKVMVILEPSDAINMFHMDSQISYCSANWSQYEP